jgi:hypothetical protein
MPQKPLTAITLGYIGVSSFSRSQRAGEVCRALCV